MDDLSYVANAHESSECSSSTDGEEKIVSEQLIGIEQNYFSALNFSVNPFNSSSAKPEECEELSHTESDLEEICEGKDALYQFVQSYHNGLFLDQISVALESEKPNWSVNGLLKGSFLDGSYGDSSSSNLLDYDPKLSKLGAFNDGISYYRKMIATDDTLSEELFTKDEQKNIRYGSNVFTLKDGKVHSRDNFLSKNPMFTKNSFLNLRSDPVEGEDTHNFGQSLPYFDFSSVEDPCKGCLENFSADFDSGASAPTIKSVLHDKQCCDQEFLVDKTKIRNVNTLSELKEYKQDDVSSALVSGGSSWESLLGRSSNTTSDDVGDLRESSLGKIDIPLDFIIDKCLLQEIILQYPYSFAKYRS